MIEIKSRWSRVHRQMITWKFDYLMKSLRSEALFVWPKYSKSSLCWSAPGMLGLAIIFFGLPGYLLLYLANHFSRVSITRMNVERLGHQVLETDVLLSRHATNRLSPIAKQLYFFSGKPANREFARLVRRRFCIIPSLFAGPTWSVSRRMGPHLVGDLAPIRHLSPLGLGPNPSSLADYPVMDDLKTALSRLKLDPFRPFVCIWVRDSEYGERIAGQGTQEFADYRNATLENYVPLIELLLNRGFSVIRMGRFQRGRLNLGSPDFIDYSASPLRSDEFDLVLSKYCAFAIAGDSGAMSLPIFYRRPLALVNIAGLHGVFPDPVVSIFTMKTPVSMDSGTPISLSDLVNRGGKAFNSTSDFREAGIAIQENSSDELRGVGADMCDLISGQWKTTRSYDAQNRELATAFSKGLGVFPSFSFSKVWLANNPTLAKAE